MVAADLIADGGESGEGDNEGPNDCCANDTGTFDDGGCDGSLSSSDDEVEAEEAPSSAAAQDDTHHQAIRDHAQRLLGMSSMRSLPPISKNDHEQATGDASRANAETLRDNASVALVAASPVAAAGKDGEGVVRFEIKSVPQWRFTALAKKKEGYSTKSAGEFVQGKSSEELGAKYVAPDVSLYRTEKTSISVGRLDVKSPTVAEIERNETHAGKLKLDDDRTTEKDIELGQETEGGAGGGDHWREAPNDSNSSALDDEEVPIEVELEAGEVGEPAVEELPSAAGPNKNNAGTRKRRRKPIITTLLIMILLVIIAVLSTLLLLRGYEEVEIKASNAATAGGSVSGQGDITGIEAATQSVSPTTAFSFATSTLPSSSSGEPSVTFSDAPSLQSSSKPSAPSQSLPGSGLSIDWTPYLYSTSTPTVSKTSRPSMDDTSRPSVASSTQPSTEPSVVSSPQPSTQPSNEPVPACTEGTRLFSIQYPTSISTTMGSTDTKWAFKDPCTGEVVSECLPCSSGGNGGGLFGGSGLLNRRLSADDGAFAPDVSPFERNRRMQGGTLQEVFQCLPEGKHYVFEISLADSDECCGFNGSTAIISYDGEELSFEAARAFSAESHFGQEKSCPTDPPSISPAKPSPSLPCPPNYKPRVTYEGGDLVINPQGRDETAVVYSCRGFPYTVWCAQQAYEPGVALNYDQAWETLGSCEMQPAALSAEPSLSPLPFLSVCPPIFDTSATYTFGEQVTYSFGDGNYVYECDVVLCRSYGAEPSASSWTRTGACSLASAEYPLVTTASPSVQPSFSPTKQPTRRPSQVPSSSEPSSSPKMTSTGRPTISTSCDDDPVPFNACFAIDMAGSVCNGESVALCERCGAFCQQQGFGSTNCCETFVEVKSHATFGINVLSDLPVESSYSIVQYASQSQIVQRLTTESQALGRLGWLAYTGGLSDYAKSIELCQESLPRNGRKNLIIIIGGGLGDHRKVSESGAVAAASLAKASGAVIVPILISPGPTVHSGAMSFFQKMATEVVIDAREDLSAFDRARFRDLLEDQVKCTR